MRHDSSGLPTREEVITICVAIAQGQGAKTLTIDQLERGWNTNPDGGGYAYINEHNRIVTFKSMDMDTFILSYIDAHEKYGATSPFVVHMRVATHGKVDITTTHPFTVNLGGEGEMIMAHNGIIGSMDVLTDEDTSDTMAFIEHVLEYLSDDWLDSEVMVDMVDEYIGWSKLVFLTTSPRLKYNLYIVNEESGHWEEDTWFSNTSCQPSVRQSVVSGYTSQDYEAWANDYWGKHNKGTWKPTYSADRGFDAWLEDADGPDLLFQPEEMRLANVEHWSSMVASAIADGATCTMCMGRNGNCYCSDTCAYCFEQWSQCDCSGEFVSISTFEMEREQDRIADSETIGNVFGIVESNVKYNVIYDDNDNFVRVEKVYE